jgi:hypothetical protein
VESRRPPLAPKLLGATGVRTTRGNGWQSRALAAVTVLLTAAGAAHAGMAAVEPPQVQAAALPHALSVQAGIGFYSVVGGTTALIAGPKLAFDGGFALGRNVWFDLGLGLVFGGCMRRGDEGDCVLSPGQVVEPVAGIRVVTAPDGRLLGYARVVAGAVAVSSDKHGASAGGIVRGGVGIKGFGTGPVAFGVEGSVVAGVGSFTLKYGAPASALVGFDLLAGVEIRF